MCQTWFCFIPLEMTSIPHTNPVDPAFLKISLKLPRGSRGARNHLPPYICRSTQRHVKKYELILVDRLAYGQTDDRKPTTGNDPTPVKLVTYESMGIDVATLSDLIVQDYFGNYKIVSALAQEYGFKYFFFLPPSISLGNKTLTPEEQEMKHMEESETALHKLSTAVYHTIERESSKYQNFYSMVHVLDRYDSLMWIDEGHVTPIGNQVIAERMLTVIQARSSAEK